MSSPESLQFNIHPSVVFQLGSDLISDEMQALIELAKNSYDAGASYALIDINTKDRPVEVFEDSMFPDAKGYVSITDDGVGMDLKGIRSGWLVIADSEKRRFKKTLQSKRKGNASGRVPLGDKGLGRLGTQRLGKNLEVVTKVKGEKGGQHIGFSWSDFDGPSTLAEVPIKGPFPCEFPRKNGTTILVSGVINSKNWTGSDKERYEERLASLISPFQAINDFKLQVSIDGTKLDLVSVGTRLRKEADVAFRVHFDGNEMKINGAIKHRSLEPAGSGRKQVFAGEFEKHGGGRLAEHLGLSAKGKRHGVARHNSKAWYLRFSQTFLLDEDIEKVVINEDGSLASPGPFDCEIDSYSLDNKSAAEQSAFSSAKQYRAYIKRLAGIYVYRDGFGVHVGRDFLDLGKAWTGGQSWYGLKPGNVLGYVSISAADNPQLVETTDREGFKRTPEYENFELLMERFTEWVADVLEHLHRGAIEFCDNQITESAGLDVATTPEQLSDDIEEQLRVVTTIKSQIKKTSTSIAGTAGKLKSVSENATPELFGDSKALAEAKKSLDNTLKSIEKGKSALDEAFTSLSKVEQLRKRFDVLRSHLQSFDERLASAYDAIGLGIVAESLAHEINHITSGLAERTASIQRKLKEDSDTNKDALAYTRHVKSAVTSLKKQMSHLDPALRYAREDREEIDLREFLIEIKKHHESRWQDVPLRIQVDSLDNSTFKVDVNRGKLTQICDNLILNSEYWLKEALRREWIPQGLIKFELQAPLMWVSDNGRGIDPKLEGEIFDPFVSAKPKGRGLGLFIVKEFLGSEGCTISLFPERNDSDRLFAFELDLSGIICG